MRYRIVIILMMLAAAAGCAKPPAETKYSWELYVSPRLTADSFTANGMAILPAVTIPFDPSQQIYRETIARSEEHTSELQSRLHLVCRLLFFNDPAPPEIYPLSLHDALPIFTANGMAILPAVTIPFDPSQQIYRETIAGLLYESLKKQKAAPKILPLDYFHSA